MCEPTCRSLFSLVAYVDFWVSGFHVLVFPLWFLFCCIFLSLSFFSLKLNYGLADTVLAAIAIENAVFLVLFPFHASYSMVCLACSRCLQSLREGEKLVSNQREMHRNGFLLYLCAWVVPYLGVSLVAFLSVTGCWRWAFERSPCCHSLKVNGTASLQSYWENVCFPR